MPSLSERVRSADVIAIVSVTGVTTNYSNAAGGQRIRFLAGDGSVERALKGVPPKTIRLKQEITAVTELTTRLETGRFLAYLKRSGDAYTVAKWYDLARVLGPGGGTDRVTGPYLG